jgi:hypothetical protein
MKRFDWLTSEYSNQGGFEMKNVKVGRSLVILGVMVLWSFCSLSLYAAQSNQAPSSSQKPMQNPGLQQGQAVPLGQGDIKLVDVQLSINNTQPEYVNNGDELSVTQGATLKIMATYYLYGCVKNPFLGRIEVDGQSITEQTVTLSPNASECKQPYPILTQDGVVGGQWTAAALGKHTVKIALDSSSVVTEAYESNNIMTFSINVKLPPIQLPKDVIKNPVIPMPR